MNLKKMFKNVFWTFTSLKTIENLPDSVVFLNSAGFVTRANKKACECFKITDNDINKLKFDNFIINGLEAVKSSVRNQKPILATAKVEEREFFVELNATRQWSGFCLILRDITQLINQAETDEKTARFNGEKNAMLVKLESEIKSPITSILGFSQGLLDGLSGDLTEKQNKYIKIINSNSNDLYNFIDKFLEFSYAESSLYESEYKNFDIVEAIKNIVKNYTLQCEENKVEITFDYDLIDKRTVFLDFKAFSKAVKNIIETSLAMTENGSISIELGYPDQESLSYKLLQNKSYMRLIIKDSSSGIDKNEIKSLCDPYAQLDNGKRNLLRALKLGSACILIRRAGGYIDINSEPSCGVNYEIIVPVEKEENE